MRGDSHHSFSTTLSRAAFAITAVLALITIVWSRLISASALSWLSYMPAVLLILLHGSYEHRLAIDIALLGALWFTGLYLSISKGKSSTTALMLYLGLACLCYYSCGGAFLVMAVLCAMDGAIRHRRYFPAAVILCIAALLPWCAVQTIFINSVKNAYLHGLPFGRSPYHPAWGPYVCCVGIPALFALALMRDQIRVFSIPAGRARWIASGLTVGALFAAAAAISFESSEKLSLQMLSFERSQKWDAIIDRCRKLARWNTTIGFSAGRALYARGRLLSDLFSFPQFFGAQNLFAGSFDNPFTFLYAADLFFDMGQLNESQHWAYEALTVRGETPWVLQRLSLITR
jgi:hypothetical protein